MRAGFVLALSLTAASAVFSQQPSPLPSGALAYGGFAGEFRADGTFSIAGQGWPTFKGTWKAEGTQIALALPQPEKLAQGLAESQVLARAVKWHSERRVLPKEILSDIQL